VRILPHNFTIFARSRLGLIRVHNEEAGSTVTLLGHETPLESGWKSRSSASTKTRVFDFLYDPIGSHVHDFFGEMIISSLEGVFEAPVLFSVEIGKDSILV
jgi:hypothetical protein